MAASTRIIQFPFFFTTFHQQIIPSGKFRETFSKKTFETENIMKLFDFKGSDDASTLLIINEAFAWKTPVQSTKKYFELLVDQIRVIPFDCIWPVDI